MRINNVNTQERALTHLKPVKQGLSPDEVSMKKGQHSSSAVQESSSIQGRLQSLQPQALQSPNSVNGTPARFAAADRQAVQATAPKGDPALDTTSTQKLADERSKGVHGDANAAQKQQVSFAKAQLIDTTA